MLNEHIPRFEHLCADGLSRNVVEVETPTSGKSFNLSDNGNERRPHRVPAGILRRPLTLVERVTSPLSKCSLGASSAMQRQEIFG